jgi:hypothetical protein
MLPPAAPAAVKAARKRLLELLERDGLMLVHDAELPCATHAITGERIPGSWWGHAKGNLIYEALAHFDDVARVKLVRGKDTLIHRKLWSALYRVGTSQSAWQLEELPSDARTLLKRIGTRESVRADRVELDTSRKIGAVAQDLERRLLIMTDTLHTEGGHHVRVFVPWEVWQKREKLDVRKLPVFETALEELSAPVRKLSGTDSLAGLVPWALQGAPSRPASRAAKTAAVRTARAAPKKSSRKRKSG